MYAHTCLYISEMNDSNNMREEREKSWRTFAEGWQRTTRPLLASYDWLFRSRCWPLSYSYQLVCAISPIWPPYLESINPIFKLLTGEFLTCMSQPLLFLAFKHKDLGFAKQRRVYRGTQEFPQHGLLCQLWFRKDLGVRHNLRVRCLVQSQWEGQLLPSEQYVVSFLLLTVIPFGREILGGVYAVLEKPCETCKSQRIILQVLE